jgi:glycosyltransferase involved in cell wall biosynthesis
MRLLGLTNTYPPDGRGGYAEICADVMDGLAGRGHSATLLTCRSDAGLPVAGRVGEVVVRRELTPVLAAWRRPRLARTAAEADAALIRRELAAGVDAALVWHLRGVVKSPVRLLHEHGVPVLYMLHDRWVLYERPGSVYVPWARAERLAVRALGEPPIAGEGVVCFNSDWLRDEHARLGWHPRDAHVIRCGLPPSLLERAAEEGAPRGAERLLFAGRIDPGKGLHDAVTALAELPPQVTLSIAGPVTRPDYAERVRALAAELGVADRVDWLGELARPALIEAFGEHDVLVYPSRDAESFGLGILEGQASGVVAVTSAPGGPREFLVDDVNCLLHDPGDSAGLAAAILRLRDEPGLADRLRAGGRETAASMPVAAVVDEVEQLLETRVGVPHA